MKQLKVGSYYLGSFSVDVYLREGSGGDFYYAPERGAPPRMKIGVDGSWNEIVSWLLHEAAEFVLSNIRCRYELDDINSASDRYIFHADHYQFSAMCKHAGEFMASCLPDLANGYRAFKKKAR